MKSQAFLLMALVVLVGNLEIYRHFQFYFSGTDELKVQNKDLKEKIKSQELKFNLVQYQFDEFKQDVATHLPEVAAKMREIEQGYPIRNIASLVTTPLEIQRIEKASSLFEKGKKQFRDGKFKISNRIFQTLVEKYPESVHVIESYFFLIEGKYQTKELEECVTFVEMIMSKYPENDLTGWSLLRLGKVYEIQERFEDAVEVYKTVIGTYSDSQLKKQADVQLKLIKL